LKYELESFSEARVISHVYKPFDGNDQIDDSSKGSITDLWEIDNKQNELFKDFEKVIMIPHTEHIIVKIKISSNLTLYYLIHSKYIQELSWM